MPEFEAMEPSINGDFFVEDSINNLCTRILKWTSLNDLQREKARWKCYEKIDIKYSTIRLKFKKFSLNIIPKHNL